MGWSDCSFRVASRLGTILLVNRLGSGGLVGPASRVCGRCEFNLSPEIELVNE